MSSWPFSCRTDGCCWLEWCIRIWSSSWADDRVLSKWANVGIASGNDCYIVIEHGPWKIVDLPIKDCDFPWFLVCLPEGIYRNICGIYKSSGASWVEAPVSDFLFSKLKLVLEEGGLRALFFRSRHPEIFRDAGVWRSEYESYGPEVWEKEVAAAEVRCGKMIRNWTIMSNWLWV